MSKIYSPTTTENATTMAAIDSPSKPLPLPSSKTRWTFPYTRYLTVFLCFSACFIICFARVNLNIALVQMSKPPVNESTWNSTIPYQKSYGWNQKTQGIILGSFFWTYTIFQVPSGVLAEFFGGKWMVSIALISSVILNLLTPVIAESLVLFVGSRMLLGMLQAGVFSGSFAILTDWVPSFERSLSYSMLRVGAIIGTVCINVLSGYLIDAVGWPSVFYVPSFITIAFTVVYFVTLKNRPNEFAFTSESELALIAANNVKRVEPKWSQIPFKLIFTNGPVLSAGFLKFSYFWLFFTIQSKLPTYLDAVVGMDIKSNGNVNGMFTLFNGISLTVTGWLSDQVIHRGYLSRIATRKLFVFIAIIGSGFLLAVIPSISSKSALLTLLYSSALLLGFSSGGDVPLPAEMSPNMPATIFSLVNMLSMFSGFCAPHYAGIILDSVPGTLAYRWSIIFYTTFAICLIATTLFFIFASCERQHFDYVVAGQIKEQQFNKKKETIEHKDESNCKTTVSLE